jgi:hypothetical protein
MKLARLLKCAHVGCKNHQLNLDIEDYIRNNTQMSAAVTTVHATMVEVKGSLKNSAMLRRVTDLVPEIPGKTRWSGKFKMLKKFLRIHDALIEVNESDQVNQLQNFDSTADFKKKVKKSFLHLEEMNAVTVHMQTKELQLEQSRYALDTLQAAIDKYKSFQEHKLFRCQFKLIKSSVDSELAPNKDFEAGVVKMQRGLFSQLTTREKVACQRLLKCEQRLCNVAAGRTGDDDPDNIDDDEDDAEGEESPENMKDRLKKARLDPSTAMDPYVDCSFIFGSAAEVERLWSVASYVLTDQRSRMTPMLFEAILFLRYNERFWNQGMVTKAIVIAKENRAEARAKKMMEQDDEFLDDESDD